MDLSMVWFTYIDLFLDRWQKKEWMKREILQKDINSFILTFNDEKCLAKIEKNGLNNYDTRINKWMNKITQEIRWCETR